MKTNEKKYNINKKVTRVIEDNCSYLEIEFTIPNPKPVKVINTLDSKEVGFSIIEEKYVGFISVSSSGKVSWSIADFDYFDDIIEVVNYIMGKDRKILAHYETQDEDITRCSRILMYIQACGLMINRKYNYSNNIRNMENYSR